MQTTIHNFTLSRVHLPERDAQGKPRSDRRYVCLCVAGWIATPRWPRHAEQSPLWWHPNYRRGDLHTLQVVSKTVTSATIGVAGTRHEFPSLDTPVLKFFDESKVANVDERKGRITIRHLLTMTAGLEWHENVPYNDPRNSSSHGSSGGLGAVRD